MAHRRQGRACKKDVNYNENMTRLRCDDSSADDGSERVKSDDASDGADSGLDLPLNEAENDSRMMLKRFRIQNPSKTTVGPSQRATTKSAGSRKTQLRDALAKGAGTVRRPRCEEITKRESKPSSTRDRPRRQGRTVNYNDMSEDDVVDNEAVDLADDKQEDIDKNARGLPNKPEGRSGPMDDNDTSEDSFRPLASNCRAARGSGSSPVKKQRKVAMLGDTSDEASDHGSPEGGTSSGGRTTPSGGGSRQDFSGSDGSEEPSPGHGKATNPGNVDRILTSRRVRGNNEYLVKFKGVSFRKLDWLREGPLFAVRRSLVHAYHTKVENGRSPVDVTGHEDGVHPEWRTVERVFDDRVFQGRKQYYVKWCMLGYAESTWEDEEDLQSDEDQVKLQRFKGMVSKPLPGGSEASPEALVELLERGEGVPTFLNGRTLRDYQVNSFKWMVQHVLKGQNCILGDEMGLGKTAQSISVLEFRRAKAGVRGPFLVVAPLTTLGHWAREIETWTTMNCVTFSGGKEDRAVAINHELHQRKGNRKTPVHRFDVLLTSYETLRDCNNIFQDFVWDAVIVDEAHRLKAIKSAVRASIDCLPKRFLLLLTGTPIQNNMSELFSMLNLLDPERFDCGQTFLQRYGNPPAVPSTPAQLAELQEVLKPLLLRRMKEDVETLPEKEEVIIWVELTRFQRSYYKALFENQIKSLLAHSKNSELPNLRNLAMELRKVCCHPFLCNGLEEDLTMRMSTLNGRPPTPVEALEAASGKLSLLGKLLPKLRSEGRKVLIFSQFKIMLDVVEEYLSLLALPIERIDGDTKGQERQVAMDRFQSSTGDTFAFLLSTKAGGQGITLTAADTVILYDSDWNPQNDVQAMARAHRIGQTKEVTIYRLVTQKTYEEQLVNVANQKSGLNEAILGNLGPGDDPEKNAARIARLLREGAHSLLDERAADAAAEAFQEQDIGDILAQRTSRRVIQSGGKSGGTFSVASFRADGAAAGTTDAAGNDASFWRDLLPEAVKAHRDAEARKHVVDGKRSRRKVNYGEGRSAQGRAVDDDDEDFTADDGEDEDGVAEPQMQSAQRPTAGTPSKRAQFALDSALCRWGPQHLMAVLKAIGQQGEDKSVAPPQHSKQVLDTLQDIMKTFSVDSMRVAGWVVLWVATVEAALTVPVPMEAEVAADIKAANKQAARAKQQLGAALDESELARHETARKAFRVAKAEASARTQEDLIQWQSAIVRQTWPELQAHLPHGVPFGRNVSIRRDRPLLAAMRDAGARLAAWKKLDALHAVAAPGPTCRVNGLSCETTGVSELAVLQALERAGVVSSRQDLNTRLARALLAVGVTLSSVVPTAARISPEEYLDAMFPGSRVIGMGYKEDVQIAPHIRLENESSGWVLGKVPGGSGLFLSHQLQHALCRSLSRRSERLLASAQALLAAEARRARTDGNERNGMDADEAGNGEGEGGGDRGNAGEGQDAMDADDSEDENESDDDGSPDRVPAASPAVCGPSAGGVAAVPSSTGMESGFYSCDSSEQPGGPARGTHQGGQGPAVVPLKPLQPSVSTSLQSAQEVRKQGKIDKFFRMSVGSGRAKSLHCVGGPAGQDKENASCLDAST
eukprot:jgi/Ulvmu1/12238/UM086_0029.1